MLQQAGPVECAALTHCLCLCFRSSTQRPQTYMTERTCHAASTVYMHSGTRSDHTVFQLCGLADTLIKYYQANDQILLLISFTNCKLLNNWFDFSKQILCFWVFLEFLNHWNVSMFQAGTFLWGEQSSFSVERHSLVHRENSRFK